jgi:hypothetical protein
MSKTDDQIMQRVRRYLVTGARIPTALVNDVVDVMRAKGALAGTSQELTGASRRTQIKNVASSKGRYFDVPVEPPDNPSKSKYFDIPKEG